MGLLESGASVLEESWSVSDSSTSSGSIGRWSQTPRLGDPLLRHVGCGPDRGVVAVVVQDGEFVQPGFKCSGPCGTIVAMTSEALRTVRDRFSEFIDRVQNHHERVVVTRNGTPAAVLISPTDLESLEETLAVLSDAEAVAELVEAHRAYLEGDVVHGVAAVKDLRPR